MLIVLQCLDKFNNKMRINGGSLRNENIKSSRELLAETFADDASFSYGVYFWQLGLFGKESYCGKEELPIRIFKRSFSNANGSTMKFQTTIDNPVVVGDVLYDSVADEYLICTESFNIDSVHWQGKLTLCNWRLKWQNSYGDILEYPCHDINSTQYNSGEQSNKLFTIGSSQHMLTLPCDENTVLLKTPQRFFLDKNPINPTSFIVTQNDTTSYNYGDKGLVKVTVTECPNNNNTDRIDLGICDYFDKDVKHADSSTLSSVSKSVISYETKTIKSGGSCQTFIGEFFDGNGNKIDSISPHWTVISDFNDALKINEVDNKIQISIDDDSYVDEDFKIVLTDSNGNYESSLILRVESLL